MKILWANVYCLMDTSSGAAMAVREMLRQLHFQGHEIAIAGATNFDALSGVSRIKKHWQAIQSSSERVFAINDPPLTHHLSKTAQTQRQLMTSDEMATWLALYRKMLREFKPDLVFYFGGQPLDWLIADTARWLGVAVASYVANGSYTGTRWCRDVDALITDSEATAQLYRHRTGREVEAVGAFIDPLPVVAKYHERSRVLLVNPSPEKGALIAIKLALRLEKSRPDIQFEVVESRGNWHQLVRAVTEAAGQPRSVLSNVTVTPHHPDMRPMYGRARVLLALSLWWESFGRVAAEAVMNGIPVLRTNSGGLAEATGDGGLEVNLPAACFEPPFHQVPDDTALQYLVDIVTRLFDEPDWYGALAARAQKAAKRHHLSGNTKRLSRVLQRTIETRRSGLPDFLASASPPMVQSVLVHSFIGGPHSMGRVGEQLLRHLIDHRYRVRLKPFQNETQKEHWPEFFKQRLFTQDADEPFQQQIQFCSVHEARQTRLADRVTPWFFHDVEGLSSQAVNDINTNDWVYVTSQALRDIFLGAGVRVPVHVLPLGVNTERVHYQQRSLSGKFEFLCVAEHTPRKNLVGLIEAFKVAVEDRSDVTLHIKTGRHDATELIELASRNQQITIQNDDLDETDLIALYHRAHCFVLPTRFEGFGMPLLEAMATGLPVITTDYSGQRDFCHRSNSYLIAVRQRIPADKRYFPYTDGWWAEPDFDEMVSLMRQVVDNPEDALAVGRHASEQVRRDWDWRHCLARAFPAVDQADD